MKNLKHAIKVPIVKCTLGKIINFLCKSIDKIKILFLIKKYFRKGILGNISISYFLSGII
uniref:hypothetical protein n=1 Tax=Buchnera aphidicola TaxID=9 RepID=UPI003F5CBEAA